LKERKPDEAFESLKYIIAQPSSMFIEPALVAATRIAFSKNDFSTAAELYLKLINTAEKKTNISEAEVGLMRCYVKLNEYQNTILTAQQVLLQDKVQAEIKREAMFNIANAYLKQNDVTAAIDWFKKVAIEVNSLEGAEAKYRVAELLYNQGEKDAAEKEIYDFIDLNTPHVYWMGRSFLLLSDILLAKNDQFQALQTLQSVIDYYTIENDGIKEEAIQKKKIITDKIDTKVAIPEEEQLEIKIR
jgi:tetratricopeptide (TPR) repeat protein